MTFSQWWVVGELSILVSAIIFLILRIFRKAKSQVGGKAIKLPGTLREAFFYISKLFFFLILLLLLVMAERNIFAVIVETSPSPSGVPAPLELDFEAEAIAFESTDGLTMLGWLVPSRNDATIILLHGYGGNRTAMIWHARQLIKAGYGILMYDERASGESEGKYRSYGWEDTRDVKGALEFLSSRKDTGEHVGIAGCSTGANIALYSAALYPEIGATWGDGNSSVRAQDLPLPSNWLTAAMIPSNHVLDWMYTVKLGIDAPLPLVNVIGNVSPRPVMLVGGGKARPGIGSEADLFTLRFAEIAGPNATSWIIPEATHCDGPSLIPEEYAAKFITFFDSAFGMK